MKSNKSTNVNMNASANINIQHLTKKKHFATFKIDNNLMKQKKNV